MRANADLVYANHHHRGFVLVQVTPEEHVGEFWFVSNVASTQYEAYCGKALGVERIDHTTRSTAEGLREVECAFQIAGTKSEDPSQAPMPHGKGQGAHGGDEGGDGEGAHAAASEGGASDENSGAGAGAGAGVRVTFAMVVPVAAAALLALGAAGLAYSWRQRRARARQHAFRRLHDISLKEFHEDDF